LLFRKSAIFVGVLSIILCASVIGCSLDVPILGETFSAFSRKPVEILTNERLEQNASLPRLDVAQAVVVTDNDTAFDEKLDIIQNAKRSLDLAYYIYERDFSSSLLTKELIKAANRGVRVRVLLDYHSNYKNLDLYRMLERYGNAVGNDAANDGGGSLEVRFFNRPTAVIIRDAAFATLGCSDVGKKDDLRRCSTAKYAEIEKNVTQYKNILPASNLTSALNYNSGGSGLFLSGLYTKNIDVMTFAITHGQQISFSSVFSPSSKNNASRTNNAKKLEIDDDTEKDTAEALRGGLDAAKIYWRSRRTNEDTYQRIRARVKLAMAFVLYGDKLNPIYDTLTAYFPVGKRADTREAIRDWDYLTEFLHHKLLLADEQHFVLGGRNIEDAYHMQKNSLTPHYVFADTDLRVDLQTPSPALTKTFEKLWNFRTMVADLKEVTAHAPNDFLQATVDATNACEEFDTQPLRHQACYNQKFLERFDKEQRILGEHQLMTKNAALFRSQYAPRKPATRSPSFPIDRTASLYYLENLPFKRPVQNEVPVRTFGVRLGEEDNAGKYIHNIWLSGIRHVCREATAENPREIVLHNAYFFLPSNIIKLLSEMVDGTIDCSNVRVTVLTNSPETTDLAVINLASRYAIRAFAEYYAKNHDKQRGAALRYYEYLPQGTDPAHSSLSLHSKVTLLGSAMFVGSANADVRSFMMDTNNGIFVQNAPRLTSDYLAWIESLLANRLLVDDRASYFMETSHEEMLQRDREIIAKALAGLVGEQSSGDVPPPEPLVKLIQGILGEIYLLSVESMMSSSSSTIAQQKFNSFFKLL